MHSSGELDPSTATGGRLMIGMFSMLAEFEIDLKAERAAAAREAAAARGQHTGRPRSSPPPKPPAPAS
ncbi:recombinase family protein [Rhodococcus hoagii]|nr:recombinase family protein [Prescottella equi]